jgi:hypothetical protein
VWKNIRERVQKYDLELTNTSALKNFFILVWLEFQQIDIRLIQILLCFWERIRRIRVIWSMVKESSEFYPIFDPC